MAFSVIDALSDDVRIHKISMEESASESSPPPPPHYQQAEAGAAPIRLLPDRPPVPGSTRPHVQVQQYGRHDEEEEHNPHHATRYLPPLSRLPDPPISHEESSLPPARPAQPPRRIVPQAPEEQEQEEEEEEEAGSDDEVVPSHLFVRPPRDHHPVRSGQHDEADEGDGSENDTPALPVLQRRSVDSIPPPPATALHHLPTSPSDNHEHDSDHDGQGLPVRPRHTAVLPTPPTPVIIRPTPRRSVPSAPEDDESFSSSYVTPLVAVSEPEPGEVLDDEEGGKCLFFCTKILLTDICIPDLNEQIPLILRSTAQADELLRRIYALQHKLINQDKYHLPLRQSYLSKSRNVRKHSSSKKKTKRNDRL